MKHERAESTKAFAGYTAGAIGLLGLAACVQIADLDKPTLIDEGTGGAGGRGNQNAESSSSGLPGTSSGSITSGNSSSSGSTGCLSDADCAPVPDTCRVAACVATMCTTTNAAAGTKCGMTGVCDSTGSCIECVTNADCGMAGTCVNGQCSSCTNGKMDGNETGVDCGGPCQLCNGEICGDGTACKSGFCVDNRCCDTACDKVCMECNAAGKKGTCTNIPVNGTDSAPACSNMSACNGMGACKVANGGLCFLNSECISNNCMLSMGFGVCAP